MSSITHVSQAGGGGSGCSGVAPTAFYRAPGPSQEKIQTFIHKLFSGKAPFHARPGLNFTPLHQAALLGSVEEISELAAVKGAKINARDAGGRTPLHYAALACRWLAVVELERLGANPVLRDEYEGTAADISELTRERDLPIECGFAVSETSHAAAEDLLKLWMCVKPTRQFEEFKASRVVPPFAPHPLRMEETGSSLGIQVRAVEAIAEGVFFAGYEGLFCGPSLTTQEWSPCFEFFGAVYPPHPKGKAFLDGVVDAEALGSLATRINDGPPNAGLRLVICKEGLPLRSLVMAERHIKENEVISVHYQNHAVRYMAQYHLSSPESLRALLLSMVASLKRGLKLTKYEANVLHWFLATPLVVMRLLEEKSLIPSDLLLLVREAPNLKFLQVKGSALSEAMLGYLEGFYQLFSHVSDDDTAALEGFCSWTRELVAHVESLQHSSLSMFQALAWVYRGVAEDPSPTASKTLLRNFSLYLTTDPKTLETRRRFVPKVSPKVSD